MQTKKYADTDFFLALMKNSDWLKKKARKLLKKYKNEIFVSPFTVAELMVVCKRESIPLKETLFQISRIVKLDVLSWDIFFGAVEYIDKGATIFDSLLMAFCGDNQIISSDNVYKKFNFKVINSRKN